LDTLARAPKGKRNDQLNKAAFALGQLVASGALQRDLAEERLYAEGTAIGLGEQEVRATVRSGLEAGLSCPRAAPGEGFHHTDLGNARRLVAQHGPNIRCCHQWRRWLIWDGTRWLVDETGEIERLARQTVASVYWEAGEEADSADRKKLAAWAIRSEAEAKLRAMVNLARAEPGVPVTPYQLDADPWLLNCLNGTLHLRTGELFEHRRENLCTKIVPVAYDPEAACPRWDEFLLEIMGNNRPLVAYLQRVLGYTLTGSTQERVFFLLHGEGDNGKSTFVETIRRILGDYAITTEFSTFLVQKSERVRDDVADLVGARFVSAVEADAGKQFAEALVKRLTGGEDQVKARQLYAKLFGFKPQCKFFLAVNHKPAIRGTDNAIWNRVHLIPFRVVIPKKKQDKSLVAKLRSEWPGILAWMVHGCLTWQKEAGLHPPKEVLAATQSYRAEMDTLGAFLDECCFVDAGATVTVGDLYAVFLTWGGGTYKWSRQNFGMRLKERGYTQVRRGKGGIRTWVGLGLLETTRNLQLAPEEEEEGDI
jgi:putative DNA primase/helicase